MVDYVKFKNLAKRLIEANGRTISLLRSGVSPITSGQPWRGSTNQALVTPASSISTKGLFVHPFLDSDLLSLVSIMEIPYNDTKNSQNLLLHADLMDGLSEAKIENFESVLDGNSTYKIIKAKLIQPGPIRVAYALEVSQ